MDSTTSGEDDDDLDQALSTRNPTSRVRFLNPAVGESNTYSGKNTCSFQSDFFSHHILTSIHVSLTSFSSLNLSNYILG